jgi:dihydroorotase
MKVVLRKATIVDPSSKHNGKIRDIFINKGKIEKISANPISNIDSANEVKSKSLHVSEGWLDIGTQIGEPGYEHRETLQSIVRAARLGGFTSIAPFPNTDPVTQTKAAVKYLIDAGDSLGFSIFPIAAVTKDCKGETLSELYDLHNSGAIAFSDGLKSIQHNGIFLNALNYIKPFLGRLIHFPQDAYLSANGQMHEGRYSTLLGMKGIPSIAEDLMVKRDISMAEYADADLIFYGVSSTEALKTIKQSKVKTSIILPYLNLIKKDSDLQGFDSNLKVLPPIRTNEDRLDLLKAMNDGLITAVSSNHSPHDEEGKKLEYPYAKFGASGIETVYPGLMTYAIDKLGLELIINALSSGPRSVLGMKSTTIEEGSLLDFTIFDPQEKWNYAKTFSKSINNPLLGQELSGKVIATISKGKLYTN